MPNEWGNPFSDTSLAKSSFSSVQLFGKNPGGEFRPNGFHNGLDFGSIDHPGNEVRAVHSGTVVFTGNPGITGLGSLVIVTQSAGINTVYQEFATSTANARVKTGDNVALGQVIGIRNTSHLHLGMTRIDWRQAQQYAFTDNGTWLDPLVILTSGSSGGAGTFDPKSMKVSQKGINLVKEFEGCRLNAYLDPVGVWTIGSGHTQGVYGGMTISQAQADTFLYQDLTSHAAGIGKYIAVQLTQNQFDALASFHFNLGVNILLDSDLLVYINSKQWQTAADEMKRYVYGGGQILPGLVRRRNAEVAMFLDFSGSGGLTPEKEDKDMMFVYTKALKGGGAEVWFVNGGTRIYLPTNTHVREANDLVRRYGGSENLTTYNYDNFGLRMIELSTTVVKF